MRTALILTCLLLTGCALREAETAEREYEAISNSGADYELRCAAASRVYAAWAARGDGNKLYDWNRTRETECSFAALSRL